MTYKIIRFFKDGRDSATINTELTLEEAQEHCKDPESSSKTASCNTYNTEWFDGYEAE